MVSWSILDWLEMRGSQLLVKYDIGLELVSFRIGRSTRNARFQPQMG